MIFFSKKTVMGQQSLVVSWRLRKQSLIVDLIFFLGALYGTFIPLKRQNYDKSWDTNLKSQAFMGSVSHSTLLLCTSAPLKLGLNRNHMHKRAALLGSGTFIQLTFVEDSHGPTLSSRPVIFFLQFTS